MPSIQIEKTTWWFDENQPLGEPGGFGQVFAGGISEGGDSLAVKRLHLDRDEAGHRELTIANDLAGRDLDFVVPVLASGQDADSGRYFVVMERAASSLREALSNAALSLSEILDVLRSVAAGLAEVSDIVHRDLKPENILLHEGVWKIADFGIARFAEEATSTNTLRGFLSPPYAAPEQWRTERATAATDIYAVGCMAYELCAGHPPFVGPSRDDFREQHLHDAPDEPRSTHDLPPALIALVLSMLRKEPAARISLSRLTGRLDGMVSAPPTEAHASSLAQAAVAVVATEAAVEAEQAREETQRRARSAIASEATEILDSTAERLISRIIDEAPPARRSPQGPRKGVELGQGRLWVERHLSEIKPDTFKHSGWDVLAGASIHVRQASDRYPGRGASLWYGRTGTGPDYRWVEVPYMYLGRGQSSFDEYPFALMDVEDADLAASGIMHVYQHAAVPVPIDDEHFEDFFRRWADRLAAAAQVSLQYPSRLPE